MQEPAVSKKMIEDARSRTSAVYRKLQQEAEENRRVYQSFYRNLAFFSGGTIALSVTYLGYLQSRPDPIWHTWSIIGSWGSMLSCSVSSLFSTFYNAHYAHYSRLREHREKLADQYETEAEEMKHVPVRGSSTRDELEEYLKELKVEASRVKDGISWARRREHLYEFLWIWVPRFAHVTFIGGLSLLFFFAVVNI